MSGIQKDSQNETYQQNPKESVDTKLMDYITSDTIGAVMAYVNRNNMSYSKEDLKVVNSTKGFSTNDTARLEETLRGICKKLKSGELKIVKG